MWHINSFSVLHTLMHHIFKLMYPMTSRMKLTTTLHTNLFIIECFIALKLSLISETHNLYFKFETDGQKVSVFFIPSMRNVQLSVWLYDTMTFKQSETQGWKLPRPTSDENLQNGLGIEKLPRLCTPNWYIYSSLPKTRPKIDRTVLQIWDKYSKGFQMLYSWCGECPTVYLTTENWYNLQTE